MISANLQTKLKNIFYWIKNHNEIIAFVAICMGVVCYSIGATRILKNFRAETFILVGGAIFVLYNYKRFSKIDWQILRIPVICIGIITALGFFTYFDTILPPKSFSALIRTMNSNIWGYFAVFILCYFFARYMQEKFAWFVIYLIAFMCALNVLAMIFLAMKNGFYHESFKQNVPFFFTAITAYNVWIPLPLAISLAGIFVFKKKLRLLFIGCFVASIIALISNGERSFFVAFAVMLFVPFIIYKYHYKVQILLVFLCVISVAFYGIYHFSANLPIRYNAHNIINNISTVWHTTPIEMGKYDKSCFESSWLQCKEESIKNGPSDIHIEHSAMSRINMTKSTLLAFWDKPFMPRVPDVLQTGEYLHKYYKKHNPQNGSYITLLGSGERKVLYYNHNHNFIAGLLFCYGVIGFGAIMFSIGYLLFIAYSATKVSDYRARMLGLVVITFVCGIGVHLCFDAFLTMMGKTFFVLLGLSIGVLSKYLPKTAIK